MGNQTDIRNIVYQSIDGDDQDGAEIARGQTDFGRLADAVINGGFEEVWKIMQCDVRAGTIKDISRDVAAEICWASYRSYAPLADNLREFVEGFGYRNYQRSTDAGAERSDHRHALAA